MWRWGSPGANADALAFWCAALDEPSEVSAAGGLWRTRWALCRPGSGEILGRHTGGVGAVAAVVLPGGRPVAVTGSADATVRIWDLTTGAAGHPLHVTAAVRGVAMCRSGRDVIAVIAGDGVARVDVEVVAW